MTIIGSFIFKPPPGYIETVFGRGFPLLEPVGESPPLVLDTPHLEGADPPQ